MRRICALVVLCGCGSSSDDSVVPGYHGVGAPVASAGGRVVLGADAPAAMRLAVRTPDGTYLVPIVDPVVSGKTIEVEAAQPGTYQIVVPDAAAAQKTYVWRAIAGVSMGGGAAAAIGLRAPDKWDLVGDLGGEPGPSTQYTLDAIANYIVGGFAPQRQPFAGTYEIVSSFEHLTYQDGSGVGLTLDRHTYARATRDLARALGNPAIFNAASSYLPPGVGADWLARADRCANPVVLSHFYDRRFNPDGSLPVITFCDGGVRGDFDPAQPQTDSFEVLLAVDKNGNGRRDPGEPVIVQGAEPFTDSGGPGGVYHPLLNAGGTAGNGVRDEGEAFEDVGLDGVPGTGDYGEGDGQFTVSPGLARWIANDAGRNLRAMTAAQRARIAIYCDAGIRDFFNSHVATAAMVGTMAVLGMPVTMWNGFPRLGNVATEATYDALKAQLLGDNMFVRYGDPAASDAQIAAGDGRHVGTPLQLIARLLTLFVWLDARWPDGDRDRAESADGELLQDQHFISPTTGRDNPYAVALPPGYASSTKRYPVVYFLHGYGQSPDDLLPAAGVITGYMTDGRLQKMIIVFVDGRCRAGDGCESGTFFMDSPSSPQAKMERHLYELRDEIDRKFRAKD